MKTLFVLFCVLAAFLLFGCVNDTAAQGGVVVRGPSLTQPPPAKIPTPDNETTVYVTQNGTKYHTADCPLLGESFFPVTLEQALLEGKEPCRRCH